MRNRILQTLLIGFFSLIVSATYATTYTYDATGWSGGSLPPNPLPASDNIVIDANYTWGASPYTSLGTITVNAGRELKFVNNFINRGSLVNNGTFITANLDGGLDEFHGFMQNYGSIQNNVGGSFQITGQFSALRNENGGVFENNGTVTNSFQFQNQTGGTLNNNSVVNSPNTSGTIINNGTINISGLNATMSYYCAFVNSGTINITSGGKLVIGTSSLLTGGTLNWTGGIIAVRGGVLVQNGTNFIIPLGATLWVGDDNNYMYLQIRVGSTLTNNGTLRVGERALFSIWAGGNLVNNNSAIFSGRGVNVEGGTFTNTNGATLTGNGGLDANPGNGTPGTINNNGTFINTRVAVYSGGIFNNLGTMTDGYFQVNSGGILNNSNTINMTLATTKYVFNTNPVVFPNGSFNWNAGTVEIGQQGVLNMNTDMLLNNAKNLNVLGQLNITNGTSLNIEHGTKLTLGSNGIVTNNGNINNYGLIDNAGTLNNTFGTISLLASDGTNQGTLHLKNTTSSILPNGTFNWNSGIVSLIQSSMTINNNFTIPANASFQSDRSVFSVGTTGTITNNGSFRSIGDGTFGSAGGSMINNGTFTNNSSASFQSERSVFTVGTTGMVTNNGSFISINGGSLTNNGIFTNSNNAIFRTEASAFTVGTTGMVTNNGSFISINGGSTTNNGIFTNSDNSILRTEASAFTVGTNGRFTNNGSFISINGGSTTNNGTFINSNNAFFRTDAGVFTVGTTGTFTNNGSFNSVNANSTTNNGMFINNNVAEINATDNNGIFINNQSVLSYGSRYFYNNINGTVKGVGTFSNTYFLNYGKIAPGSSPGCLVFLGDGRINHLAGRVEIEINGLIPCSQFDQIVLPNQVVATGILNLNFGYTPTVGSTFQIFRSIADNYFGNTFSAINVTPNTISVTYNTNNGDIVVNSSVLPIELLTFSAKANNNKTALNWQTASETNVQNFDIEKSLNGTTFEKIKSVKANNTPSVYQAFDDLFFASAYYRLKINDLDGKTAYSKTVFVEYGKSQKLQLFPNPVKDKITISDASEGSYTITDLLGREILRGLLSNKQTDVDVSALPSGLYLLQTKDGVEKFLKE